MYIKIIAFVLLALGGFVVYGSNIINKKVKLDEKVNLKEEYMKYEKDKIATIKNQKANIIIKTVGLAFVIAGVIIVLTKF